MTRKSKPPEQIEQEKADQQKMWRLFEEHWELKTRKIYDYNGHICEACGEQILGENKSLYHHHCWPKSKYPEHAYKIEGLMLVCWQCHSNIENAHISDEVKEKIEKIKQSVI